MKTKIITIANQKGGVGKTTTALQIGSQLTAAGNKVLLMDMDPQSNLTLLAGGMNGSQGSITDLFSEKDAKKAAAMLPSIAIPTNAGDLIPGSLDLSVIQSQILDEYVLADILAHCQGTYDWIIIDTPPTLGVLTMNALTASNFVLIPVQASILSLQGLVDLQGTVEAVQRLSNPVLAVAGILITRYRARTTVSKEMSKEMQKAAAALGTKVYRSRIREAAAIEEANTMSQGIDRYAPKSAAAEDYRAFMDEFLEDVDDDKEI